MANIYLDANILISIVEKRKETTFEHYVGHNLFVSPLSFHILVYLYKYKIPNEKLANLKEILICIPFNKAITLNALKGPTKDFEDNVQLHSAAEGECDIFLTEDKDILKMKFFGKMRILSELS